VRALIAVTTAQRSPQETKILHASAVELLGRAIGYLEPAPRRAIAIGGISGTGKSVLARELAPSVGQAPGAVMLRSDIIRKRMVGATESERLPPSAYTPEMHARVYAAMREAAEALLLNGHSVIADAVHGSTEERQAIEAVARRTGAKFEGLWLSAPREILEARLAMRTGDASDATAEVMQAQQKTIDAPENWRKLETSTAIGDVLAAAKRELKM
jgi:predicted kinase